MAAASSERGSFGKLGFILAATGSAVGLGNLWKFPYMTYANEGGSFVIVYLISVLLIGAPIMMAEIYLGRRTQKSPVGALLELAQESKRSKIWSLVGWLGIGSGFVILAYYSVVAGWTVYYVGKCLAWSINGFAETGDSLGAAFGSFAGDAGLQLSFHLLFMILTVGVVIGGVQAGIERVTKVLMPMLAVLLLALVINSFLQPGFGEAMTYLFHVGPIRLDGVLEAIGQSFFSLSLGMGAMITYGSYVSREHSIPRSTAAVVVFDTLVGFMACFIMFSIIFSVPAEARGDTFGASAAILFTTLPLMFYDMPGGVVLAPLFYFLVASAALSSTISLLEVVVAYFIDTRGWARNRATVVVGGLIFLLGVPAALSLGAAGWLTKLIPVGHGAMSFFDVLDYMATNWMLPLGGLGISLFVGWALSDAFTRPEMEQGHGEFALHPLWKWSLRIFCPVAILAIILAVLSGKTFN